MLFRSRRPDESTALTTPQLTVDAGERSLPDGMKIAGAWAWRLLAIAGVLVVFGLLIIQLRDIVIPLMIAVLVAALLVPIVQFLVRHRWPKALAVAVGLLGAIVVIAGLIYLIVWQIRQGYGDIQERSITAYEDFQTWLNTTFGINSDEFNGYLDDGIAAIQADSSSLWSGALTVGTTAGHFLVGVLLVLFATLFILIDGKGIWNWIVRLFPRKARAAVDGSGHAGWITLTTFVKVQIFVALVYLGPIQALVMLGIVLLVQQIEGHVLQPLVMGAAVKVHPLAVVFAVAAGSGVAGIIGALFAVPLVATLNVMVTYIASGKWRETTRPQLKEALKQ